MRGVYQAVPGSASALDRQDQQSQQPAGAATPKDLQLARRIDRLLP